MTIRKGGDDVYLNRLFSFLQQQFQGEIIKFKPIRPSVFFVKTPKNKYIIKGYSSYNRLKVQETFTSTLKKEGFSETYTFVHPAGKEPLLFEKMYLGCIEYIEPHPESFSYGTKKERLEGLELLGKFHQVTATFEKRYQTLIPKAKLIKKWKERADFFSEHRSIFEKFINPNSIDELMKWSHWSLNGMEKHRDFFKNEPYVILHGDVAHHNFLRAASGKLMLIDFDLISIGTDTIDLVQYANRILPFLSWSLKDLQKYPLLQKKMQAKAYLYSLSYPADIFREWNRIVKDKAYMNSVQTQQVVELTMGQFYLREKFFNKLKRYLE